MDVKRTLSASSWITFMVLFYYVTNKRGLHDSKGGILQGIEGSIVKHVAMNAIGFFFKLFRIQWKTLEEAVTLLRNRLKWQKFPFEYQNQWLERVPNSMLAAMFREKEHKYRQNNCESKWPLLKSENIELSLSLEEVPKFDKNNAGWHRKFSTLGVLGRHRTLLLFFAADWWIERPILDYEFSCFHDLPIQWQRTPLMQVLGAMPTRVSRHHIIKKTFKIVRGA